VHRDGVRRVTFTATEPFPYQVDGDYLGEVTRLDFGYEPDVLTLVVP
jgi:diacylglycerol kinase family enzyme